MPVAVIFIAVKPMRRVASISERHPQSDSVSTVNDGIPVTFENKNRIMCSYFTGSVFSKGRGAVKMKKLTWNCTGFLYCYVLIAGFHDMNKFQTNEGDIVLLPISV